MIVTSILPANGWQAPQHCDVVHQPLMQHVLPLQVKPMRRAGKARPDTIQQNIEVACCIYLAAKPETVRIGQCCIA